MARKKGKGEGEGGEEIRGIVRIATKDLSGHLPLRRALIYIKGIGHSLAPVIARLIHQRLGIAPETKIGTLSYEQIEAIDNFLFNLSAKEMPPFLLNRRKDPYSGRAIHVIMNDLIFLQREDVKRKIRMRSWQGIRHMTGQPVRGQRTANTHREGKTVGVSKKKK